MRLARLSAAWVAGILLSTWALLEAISLMLGGVLLALAVRGGGVPWTGVLLLALLIGGGLRQQLSAKTLSHPELEALRGQQISVIGTLVREPEPRGRLQRALVEVEQAAPIGQELQPAFGSLLVWWPRYLPYRWGDRLELRGALEAPEPIGGFDYPGYLARRGVVGTMSYPEVQRLAEGQPPLTSHLTGLRRALGEALGRALPDPEAGVAAALLLGQRQSLTPDLLEAFQRTGTIHLLVVSGYNLTLVAAGIGAALKAAFGRRAALLPSLAAVIGYTALVGGEPPVLRAALMVTLGLLAIQLGRQASLAGSLAFTAALLAAFEPTILWEPSFQFSFLAVIGVLAVAPRWREGLEPLLERSGLGRAPSGISAAIRLFLDLALSSTAALALTAPLIAFHFQRLSLVAPAANLIAQPLAPLAMALSAPAALVGLAMPALAPLAALPAWVILQALVGIVELGASLPLAAIQTPTIPAPLIWALYGALATLTVAPGWRGLLSLPGRWQRIPDLWRRVALRPELLLLAANLAVWGLLSIPESGLFTFQALDVGQGDSLLLQTPEGLRVLVDGGADPERLMVLLGRALPWWDRDLDVVILSHPQEDHLNGLIEVVRRYAVDLALEGPQRAESAAYRAWEDALEAKGVRRLRLAPGAILTVGRTTLTALGPNGVLSEVVNDRSLVLQVRHGQVSFLLTGDIEEAGERALLRSGEPVQSTVLKVAHHGSRTSSGAAFLRGVRPAAAIISVGADNRFGHPHEDVLERLRDRALFRTDRDGTVTFSTEGQRLWVRTER